MIDSDYFTITISSVAAQIKRSTTFKRIDTLMVQNAESIVKLYSTYITKLYEIVLNINILGRDSAERRLDVIVTAVGSIPNRKN